MTGINWIKWEEKADYRRYSDTCFSLSPPNESEPMMSKDRKHTEPKMLTGSKKNTAKKTSKEQSDQRRASHRETETSQVVLK